MLDLYGGRDTLIVLHNKGHRDEHFFTGGYNYGGRPRHLGVWFGSRHHLPFWRDRQRGRPCATSGPWSVPLSGELQFTLF